MTQITTQGIVDELQSIQSSKLKLQANLLIQQEKLKELELYKDIQEIELNIRELDKKESELKETGKQIMIQSGLKKFEALNGTIVQLNKKPGALVIENEDNIPKEYFKEKTTVSIDKTTLKKDISEGLVVDGVYISEDYTLVIKDS